MMHFRAAFAPLLAAVLLAFAAGCGASGPPTSDKDLRHVEYRQLVEMLDEATENKPVVLVDVRSPEAYAQGHLPGAINIPLVDLSGRDPRLAGADAVVVYHQEYKGNYPDIALKMLVSDGLRNVYSYAAGYNDWQSRQAAPLPKDNAPPQGR